MTDIVWKTDKRTRQEIMAEMAEIRTPKAFLGDLSVDEVPVYLQALARAGRMILGMAIYGNEQDRVRAAQVLEMALEKMGQAEEDIRGELVRLGLEDDDGTDGTG
ncbi:MAG: hypothetical protein KAX80_13220 [Planctomycetes bacterium]|nr:hypothetical protein [Planctomycetota bacterium]